MRKKEFKLLLATNPKLRQWLTENESRLKANPEVMFYLTRNPEAMKHFRSDQPIDNQEILRESQVFMQEAIQAREERRNRKKKPPLAARETREPRKLPLLDHFKTMFGQKTTDAFHKKAPKISRSKEKATTARNAISASLKQIKRSPVQPFSSLKIKKLSRKKVMNTLNQTTDMLDVVGALLGKVNHLK